MVSPSSSNSSIKVEIENMLEDFKIDMWQTLALQMDTMHIKRKQRDPWPFFVLDALVGTLRMNVH